MEEYDREERVPVGAMMAAGMVILGAGVVGTIVLLLVIGA